MVLGTDCRRPLPGALLDVWQADADGVYHYEKENFRLRGQILTDREGSFEFTTIVPGRYKLGGGYRPAHIHFTVSHPAHEALTTQLYFKGDPYLPPNDACGDECKANDPDRIVSLKKLGQGAGFGTTFRIVLGGRKA
jgi:catechol 1,2-dioxygenase